MYAVVVMASDKLTMTTDVFSWMSWQNKTAINCFTGTSQNLWSSFSHNSKHCTNSSHQSWHTERKPEVQHWTNTL